MKPVQSGKTPPVPPPSLEVLMRATQAGDQKAYRLLLDQVARRMRGLVRHRAPWLSAEDVEDIIQDILLSLHRARASWDPARPFLPWIVTIARSRITDHGRRYMRRTALHLAASDIAEAFSDMRADNTAQNVVNLLSVRRAMQDLSPTERQAFDLLRLRELSLDEAAQISKSTPSALKVALHRAKRKMKAVLWTEDKT